MHLFVFLVSAMILDRLRVEKRVEKRCRAVGIGVGSSGGCGLTTSRCRERQPMQTGNHHGFRAENEFGPLEAKNLA